MRNSNPLLKEDSFDAQRYMTGDSASGPITQIGPSMTLQGTAIKALALLAIAIASTGFVWSIAQTSGTAAITPIMIVGILAGLGLAMVAVFKPRSTPIIAPLYALAQGAAVGGLSFILEASLPGIVIQAVLMTFGICAAMLSLYLFRVIRVTPIFTKVVVGCTLGIGLVFLISLGMSFFGLRMPLLWDATPLGIGISLFILVVAAMNLILDFDLIEKGVNGRAPKWMEWYGAFGLVVTILWIYIESLRLLSKLRR